MIHTRNGSNYSVQPDGSGKGRGKSRARYAKSSSNKTCLVDIRVSHHSPMSVPTTFDVSSEPELIQGNISRVEQFPSGSPINISVPVQKLVQRSQGRGVGNMPKPLEGGHELLLKHQELSGSGEDHRSIRRVTPIVFQRKGQKDNELVGEPKSLIHRPEEGVGDDPNFGERRPIGIYQLQTSSINVQRKSQRTSQEEERSQEPSSKGQRKSQLAQTLTTRVQDPQIGTIRSGQCFQYGQSSYGIHSQIAGKDEQDLSTQIIQEIQFVKTSIDVELGKCDAKLNKITSDINELKKNYRISADLHKLKTTRLDLISNACDRIEGKYQVQDYGMEDLFISNINDQLKILKNYVLEIVDNTNLFTTNLARSESERQILKDEIIAHVGKIHKNYEPNSHIPRNPTSLTEEKLSVKGSLTPFLGENAISERDIPK
ncbi:hypothetical protein O181_016070 [Austropuccinia psidii MF-1]|uniref:Uncharacterized protein n=1 Tax=Austropuccinia psidii MF-1 TaxID=1389203 RepID=A0A9Q3C527_9BASI|nr:hypothetical protein [Austropuccinia psidii MF-1]